MHDLLIFLFVFSQDKVEVIDALRDILIQEIMTIENSEFEGEAIDMDTIAFASKYFILPCRHGKAIQPLPSHKGQFYVKLCKIMFAGLKFAFANLIFVDNRPLCLMLVGCCEY